MNLFKLIYYNKSIEINLLQHIIQNGLIKMNLFTDYNYSLNLLIIINLFKLIYYN